MMGKESSWGSMKERTGSGPDHGPRHRVPSQAIEFNGQTIHIAEEMNLTEMWKASKKSLSYNPNNWMRKEGSDFVQGLNPNTPDSRISIRTKRGQGGGTFAHWQIGMAYAQYLSPELHRICNQMVKDFVEAKPEIAMSVTSRADEKGKVKIA